MNHAPNPATSKSRRDFLKTTAATVAGASLTAALASPVHASGTDTLKIALVGCGNRGAGAAVEALRTKGPTQLWALADTFQDRIDLWINRVQRDVAAAARDEGKPLIKIDVPKERQFVGLDAYRKAIDACDVVVITGPPGYRPQHFEYAVNAGKHVFMEKPVASDPAGIRRILASAEEAKKKNLKVGVGLQRRHQLCYQEAIQRINDGEIGDLVALRCYWNGGNPAKQPYDRGKLGELEYQIRNWYFFAWLSGDCICEQHVHNLDVCNWIKNGHPVEAQGMGGRQVRTGKEYGNIFDHHAVEYTYADGTKMFSQCRQIPGCDHAVQEHAHGTKGLVNLDAQHAELFVANDRKWHVSGGEPGYKNNAYQVEHDTLFDAIRNDKPYNEAEYGAHSTMTGIIGRMATYSGQTIKWDQAMKTQKPMTTDAESWDAEAPVKVGADGRYAIAVPGTTKFA